MDKEAYAIDLLEELEEVLRKNGKRDLIEYCKDKDDLNPVLDVAEEIEAFALATLSEMNRLTDGVEEVHRLWSVRLTQQRTEEIRSLIGRLNMKEI